MKFRVLLVGLVLALSALLPVRALLTASSTQPPGAASAPAIGVSSASLRSLAQSVQADAADDPTCPNLIVDPGEDCDDGNYFNGDGCDTTCHFEPAICGNGILNPDEGCDDGNLMGGDGCNSDCGLEPAVCANGVLDLEEECDDGNLLSGDGCDASCRVEGLSGVTLSVVTSTGNDTLYEGVSGSLIFRVVAPSTTEIAGFMFPMKYTFSGENTIGPIGLGSGSAYVTYSPKVAATVSIVGWNRTHAREVTNPDYTQMGMLNLGPEDHPWTGSGELWRITFVPQDTGTITIDSTHLPPANSLEVFDPQSFTIPIQWQPKTVTVLPGMPTGNVNGDAIVSAADLIYMVNFIFKAGAPPAPCEAAADVDCSGVVNPSDIIRNINYVFKAAQKPCNVAGLVGGGVWACP